MENLTEKILPRATCFGLGLHNSNVEIKYLKGAIFICRAPLVIAHAFIDRFRMWLLHFTYFQSSSTPGLRFFFVRL